MPRTVPILRGRGLEPGARAARERARKLSLRSARGPFDIVGDVHGCLEELLALMAALGYRAERQGSDFVVTPPTGRTLAFVGDLVDRGPACPQVLRLAIGMARAGQAFCVPGNRDVEFVKALKGRAVKVTHGMARALQQLEAEPEEFRAQVIRFLDWLPGGLAGADGRSWLPG